MRDIVAHGQKGNRSEIDGDAFSIESFDREFSMVLAAVEDTTNQVLKEASAL